MRAAGERRLLGFSTMSIAGLRSISAVFVAAIATVMLTSFAGCGGRAGSCAGFDSCSDVIPCPLVRCLCDDGVSHATAPTCRADETCDTASDCAALCSRAGTKCDKPPLACDAYLATECDCAATDKTKTRFAEAWDCVKGAGLPLSAKDCSDACGHSGVGGGGSSSSTTGPTSTSTF